MQKLVVSSAWFLLLDACGWTIDTCFSLRPCIPSSLGCGILLDGLRCLDFFETLAAGAWCLLAFLASSSCLSCLCLVLEPTATVWVTSPHPQIICLVCSWIQCALKRSSDLIWSCIMMGGVHNFKCVSNFVWWNRHTYWIKLLKVLCWLLSRSGTPSGSDRSGSRQHTPHRTYCKRKC